MHLSKFTEIVGCNLLLIFVDTDSVAASAKYYSNRENGVRVKNAGDVAGE